MQQQQQRSFHFCPFHEGAVLSPIPEALLLTLLWKAISRVLLACRQQNRRVDNTGNERERERESSLLGIVESQTSKTVTLFTRSQRDSASRTSSMFQRHKTRTVCCNTRVLHTYNITWFTYSIIPGDKCLSWTIFPIVEDIVCTPS